MAFLPGKFARIKVASTSVTGPFRWNVNFRRERLDTTNFESTASASGVNIHSEGLTGVLDTVFTIEGYSNTDVINVLFPDASVTCDLLFRKSVALGYQSVAADVLSYQTNTAVRERAQFTAELQANGLVSPAA